MTTTDVVAHEEPRKPKKGDDWFPDGYFSMHSDVTNMRAGSLRALPVTMRIWNIATGRANVYGHAAFAPRELEELIGKDAKGKAISKPRRLAAIRTLKSSQMIAPESTSLCIVLNSEWIRKWVPNADGYRTCIEPSHIDRQDLMWTSAYGWEPGQWQYHAYVNDPARIVERKRSRTRTRTRVIKITEKETEHEEDTIRELAPAGTRLCEVPVCQAAGALALPGSAYCANHDWKRSPAVA